MFKKIAASFYNWAFRYDNTSLINDSNKARPGRPGKRIQNTTDYSNNIHDTEIGFNFVMYNAVGGKVLQFWSHDRNTDSRTSRLYIIQNNADFAEELSHILTIETLSN